MTDGQRMSVAVRFSFSAPLCVAVTHSAPQDCEGGKRAHALIFLAEHREE